MLWTTKAIRVSQLKPGMILARPVLSQSSHILVSENAVLNEQIIRLLESWDIKDVHVKEPRLSKDDYLLSLLSEQRTFSEHHAEILNVLKTAFEKTRYFKEVPLAQITQLADQTVESLINSTGVISHLSMIQAVDDYTFRHSVNVSIIAGIIGKWLGYTGSTLKELVLTGLLHDIGKTQIPLEILNKPASLTPEEMDVMQNHPALGFELIKGANLPREVVLGVLQHHEKLDGSGYPFGLIDSDINTYARIVAVADIYDAMTSDRVYRKALTPFNVLADVFPEEMFSKLDPTITVPFISHVKDSLIGYVIRLSDGSQARVIYFDKDRLLHPVVKLASGEFVDLEKRRDLTVVEVIATAT